MRGGIRLSLFALLFVGLFRWVSPAVPAQEVSGTSRVSELRSPEPDEIVLAAAGDAIWIRKVSQIQEERLQSKSKSTRESPFFNSMGHFFMHLSMPTYDLFPDVQKTVHRVMSDDRFSESLMLRVILGPAGQIRSFELMPIEVSKDGTPYFASEPMISKIIDRIRNLSAPFGTKVSRKSWYAAVDVGSP